MRRDLAQRLLRELLKNSKRSDRELAKVLKVSQPTITRTRHKLEENGMIEDYTIIPDFREMGFEILAINLAKLRPEVLSPETSEKAREFIAKFPNTIFASTGEGMGMNAVDIALYRNYTEYHNRVNLMKTEWKDIIEDIQSFIVAIGEGEFKKFSLTHLKDVPL
ncbi:MarR family transcriptional regulator [Candidatus Bathyarchaeota archaeon]|nr:MarR family transcriptional regulator [Candidatus Bathyarchaeota archaeon]